LLLHTEQRGGGGGSGDGGGSGGGGGDGDGGGGDGGGGRARGKAGGGAAARQLRAAFASWSSAEAPLTRRWLDLRDAPAAVAVLARHRFVLCATANRLGSPNPNPDPHLNPNPNRTEP